MIVSYSVRIIYFDGNASTEMPKDTFFLDLTDEGTEESQSPGPGSGSLARGAYTL